MTNDSAGVVKAVAARCGVEDPLHFPRCFSAVFGRPPQKVRQDLKHGIAPPPYPRYQR